MALATPSLASLQTVTTPIRTMGRDGQLEHLEGYELPPAATAASVAYGPPLPRLLTHNALSKGYRRILIPHLEEAVAAVGMEAALAELPLAYAGTSHMGSFTDPLTSTKYLDASTPGGITSSELARAYLKLCRKAALARHPEIDGMAAARVPWERAALKLFEFKPPTYFRLGPFDGHHRGDFAYVDLTAAYWQVIRVATLDMRYRPERRYLGHGIISWYDTHDVLPLKQMRVSLSGIMRSNNISIIRNGTPQTKFLRSGAVFLAPDLSGYLMHTMQAIAASVIDNFDCPMVLTDAYIVQADQAEDLLEFLGDYWQMPARLEARGEGVLYSAGRYQIGNKRTKKTPPRFEDRRSPLYELPTPKALDNLDPGVRALVPWLAERRRWLVGLELERHGLHEADSTPVPTTLDLSWWARGSTSTGDPRTCEHCGWPLSTDNAQARFCSDSCSSKARNRRWRAERAAQKEGE